MHSITSGWFVRSGWPVSVQELDLMLRAHPHTHACYSTRRSQEMYYVGIWVKLQNIMLLLVKIFSVYGPGTIIIFKCTGMQYLYAGTKYICSDPLALWLWPLRFFLPGQPKLYLVQVHIHRSEHGEDFR